jgi:hypothetical protein
MRADGGRNQAIRDYGDHIEVELFPFAGLARVVIADATPSPSPVGTACDEISADLKLGLAGRKLIALVARV